VSELPELHAGVYRHYKNHLYLVLGYARDSNHEDRTVVVYIGLDLDGARSPQRMHVRTVEDFFAVVDPATGDPVTEWDGTEPCPVSRFTFVGADAFPSPRPVR
jgi:hypothetical protein